MLCGREVKSFSIRTHFHLEKFIFLMTCFTTEWKPQKLDQQKLLQQLLLVWVYVWLCPVNLSNFSGNFMLSLIQMDRGFSWWKHAKNSINVGGWRVQWNLSRCKCHGKICLNISLDIKIAVTLTTHRVFNIYLKFQGRNWKPPTAFYRKVFFIN